MGIRRATSKVVQFCGQPKDAKDGRISEQDTVVLRRQMKVLKDVLRKERRKIIVGHNTRSGESISWLDKVKTMENQVNTFLDSSVRIPTSTLKIMEDNVKKYLGYAFDLVFLLDDSDHKHETAVTTLPKPSDAHFPDVDRDLVRGDNIWNNDTVLPKAEIAKRRAAHGTVPPKAEIAKRRAAQRTERINMSTSDVITTAETKILLKFEPSDRRSYFPKPSEPSQTDALPPKAFESPVMVTADGPYEDDTDWDLFREQVGKVVDDPIIQPYARGIAEECRGSSLLIRATGKALAGENDALVWKLALKEFLLSKKVFKTVDSDEALLQKLKFSYDRLEVVGKNNPRLRGCDIQTGFLYCALFPRDYKEVSAPKLVEYWIQEGLIRGSSKKAVEKGHHMIRVLVDRALLERTKDGSFIRMEDVVKNLASGLLSKKAEDGQFLVRPYSSSSATRPIGAFQLLCDDNQHNLFKAGAKLTKPPSEEQWETARSIFFMDNELFTLPENPNCPNLSNLFLQRNPPLRDMPTSFFDHMPSLKVLDMSKTRINSVPESISNLKCLRCLNLRGCERLFRLPSGLGELKQLEFLDLFGTSLTQLPEEVGELSSLMRFEVSFYGPVDSSEYTMLPPELIPHGIIRKLVSLRYLRIDVQPGDERWDKNSEFIVEEICTLNSLTALHFYFPEVTVLQLFLSASALWRKNQLQKFNFVVGNDVKRLLVRVPLDVELDYHQQDRCLRFVNAEEMIVPDAIVQVLARSTGFYLDHHINVPTLLSEFGVENIHGLEFCVLRECPKIEAITDGEELALPCIQHLSINYLENLKVIWKNLTPMAIGSFGSMKYLCLRKCPLLEFVMTSSTCPYLRNLVEIVVEDCQGIQEIIHHEEDSIVEPDDVLLPTLKRLTLHHLPNLVSIWKALLIGPCLERTSIDNCPRLKTPIPIESTTVPEGE